MDVAATINSTASGRMVEFLCSLTLEKLPAGILQKARICLLDGLGCGLYGATTRWGKIAAQVIFEEQSQGRATVYGYSKPVAPARAALVNGTATHGIELDDIAPGGEAGVHAGAVVVPAVLAVAEQFDASGAKMLLGLIAGYEAMTRVATAIGKTLPGFHRSVITGTVGSAVAAGIALDMPLEQIMRAVGIASSSTAGIQSFVQGSGGMVKRMHAGNASEAGVRACLLARRGFTAPLAAVDGKFGLLEVFGGEHANPSALEKGLGERYAVAAWTKVYPFCGGLHAMAQALYSLRVEHGIKPEAIKHVRVGGKQTAVKVHAEVNPKDTMAAQYSMPFTAGVALARDPKDLNSFSGAALNDPIVCALAQRVELYVDPELDTSPHPRNAGARVEVHITDGSVLKKTLFEAHGMASDPCTEDEIKQKFRALAAATITSDAIDRIVSLVERIEALSTIAALSQALQAVIPRSDQIDLPVAAL